MDGNTLVVGAPNEDGGSGGANRDQNSAAATDSGAAYVFVREDGKWTQRAYINPETPIANERFGVSIALLGDLVAIGACADDPIDRPTNRNTPGAAYVFARSAGAWSQVKRLVAPDADGLDLFGFRVQLTQDSLFVTAPYESSQQLRSGAAYAFDRSDATWTRSVKLKASKPVAESAFGSSIASDANTLVVGAFSDSSEVEKGGSAYVFQRPSGTWAEVQRLTPMTPARGATFGWSAAVLGDTVVVGAPRWGHYLSTPSGEAYVFRHEAERWMQREVLQSPMARESDYFGATLLLTPSTLILAASGDSSGKGGVQASISDASQAYSGAIFLYAREAESSVRNTYIKSMRPFTGDGFAFSFTISGSVLVAGTPYDDRGGSGVNPTSNDSSRTDTGAVYAFE